jgi:3-isopropylmalate dehydrogenase
MHPKPFVAQRIPPQTTLLHSIFADATHEKPHAQNERRVLGIVYGEGIGPEVMKAALQVLDATESIHPLHLKRETGGSDVGTMQDGVLSPDTQQFFQEIFDAGGAVLCGPGGGRFVYDLRRRFDLYCKIAPVRPVPTLIASTPFLAESATDLDLMIVRDNAGGIYQGSWSVRRDHQGEVAEHQFSYTEKQVERIVTVGAKLAKVRRGRMDVVIKEGGVPTISALWRRTAQRVAEAHGVTCGFCNADFAAYDLIRRPQRFDVLVTPNMVGDILADLAAIFLGSRGLSYSANFSSCGKAVYQTGHGAAHDLAKSDRANPVGQLLAMAMMLRESYGLAHAASLVEQAIEQVYRAGYRTDDLDAPGCRRVGTSQMGELISQAVIERGRVTVPA